MKPKYGITENDPENIMPVKGIPGGNNAKRDGSIAWYNSQTKYWIWQPDQRGAPTSLVPAVLVKLYCKAQSSDIGLNGIRMPFLIFVKQFGSQNKPTPPHTEAWSPRASEYAGFEWIGIGAEADCDKLQARHESRM